MIIVNGTMQAVYMTGGGYSEGNPTAATRTMSEPIPVNISGNRTKDSRTANDTSYTSATYEVLCDDTSFDAEEIVLINNRGSRLGIFRVTDIQYLDCVDAVKIYAEQYGE